jgi:hypothetical protein
MWPDGKSFAFTIFDDPDAQTYEDGRLVYSFLSDLGFRTTRGVWPGPAVRTPNSGGETCANPQYRQHTIDLQEMGFEVGYHNATKHTSTREETRGALDAFRAYFGGDPRAMANHYNGEAIYWGRARVTPPVRTLYSMATLGRRNGVHFGEMEGHATFWGDLCRERVGYCRNFVFTNINTLSACPWMPYYDPLRPFVKAWYASTEGSNAPALIRTLSEANQDRLEQEGGACIIYTHFGLGFVQNGRLDETFVRLMKRLSRRNGWFVPVSTLLDYLGAQRSNNTITSDQRHALERRWLWEKLFRGTS